MNLTTTDSPVLSISDATHRQARFGYIPLLAIFLSNLLSNTAVAKYIPLGALKLSYDPLPLLRPLSHPTSSNHHYPHHYDPPPPPLNSEEVQHFYHHHHLPPINQQQIVNILDKKPTEIVVETETEDATESSTEHQEYRDDGLEKPGIEEINDLSAKTLFKRDISTGKEVKSPPIVSEKWYPYSSLEKEGVFETEVKNDVIGNFTEDSFRIDDLEKHLNEETSKKSVNLPLDKGINGRDGPNQHKYGHPTKVDHGFMANPLPLLKQHQVETLLYSKPINKRNEKADEHQTLKNDQFDRFDKTGKVLLRRTRNDHKMRKNQHVYDLSQPKETSFLDQVFQEVSIGSSTEQLKSNIRMTDGEISEESVKSLVKRTTVSEDTIKASDKQYGFDIVAKAGGHESNYTNHTNIEQKMNNDMVTAISAGGDHGFVNDDKNWTKVKTGDEISMSSNVDSPKRKYTVPVGGNGEPKVKKYLSGLDYPVLISDRSMRALVKRGAGNRYSVRKNNKYLYQKRRRVPEYYYDSYEDMTTSRYYNPRRRPTRTRRPVDFYEDIYDSNEEYYNDYPEVNRPHKKRRRTTTARPRRMNSKPTNRRRVQTTTSEYDDDDYAIEVIPRQGSTTITTGETDAPSSTTPGSTVPSTTTEQPVSTTTNATGGYGYGPSHGHEGISITYAPPTAGGQGLYGPPSTSYGHPQTHYGPPNTHYGTPNNGFAPSSHGYYQVPFLDWYNNDVSRTAIAKKAQDIIGFENVFN